MHQFAIHLLACSKTGHPSGPALIWVNPQPSTLEALVLARRNAPPGSVVEVWRDHECVHRETVQQ